MDKSNQVLVNYAQIRRYVARTNGITGQLLDYLLRVQPMTHFTANDINTAALGILEEAEWVEKIFTGGASGNPQKSKWRLSFKAKKLIKQLYDYTIKPETLPDGVLKKKAELPSSKGKRPMRKKRKYNRNVKEE